MAQNESHEQICHLAIELVKMEAEIPTVSVALKSAGVMATVWDRGLVHMEKALGCAWRTYPGPWCMAVADDGCVLCTEVEVCQSKHATTPGHSPL